MGTTDFGIRCFATTLSGGGVFVLLSDQQFPQPSNRSPVSGSMCAGCAPGFPTVSNARNRSRTGRDIASSHCQIAVHQSRIRLLNDFASLPEILRQQFHRYHLSFIHKSGGLVEDLPGEGEVEHAAGGLPDDLGAWRSVVVAAVVAA